jgi:hypothetical protein
MGKAATIMESKETELQGGSLRGAAGFGGSPGCSHPMHASVEQGLRLGALGTALRNPPNPGTWVGALLWRKELQVQ